MVIKVLLKKIHIKQRIKYLSYVLCLGMITYFSSSVVFSITVAMLSASMFAMIFSICLLASTIMVALPTPTEAVNPSTYK